MLTSLARIRLKSAVPLSSYGTPSEALPGPPNSDLLTRLFSAGFSFDPPSYFCKSFTDHTYETCPFASTVSPLEPILTQNGGRGVPPRSLPTPDRLLSLPFAGKTSARPPGSPAPPPTKPASAHSVAAHVPSAPTGNPQSLRPSDSAR